MQARRESPGFRALAVLYFASGAVALVDEVIFSKYLEYAFGATAYASSAVLVAFMGGLALGAAAMARLDARVARPLFVYGLLEVGVGVAAAISPWLLSWVTSEYVSFASRLPPSVATIAIVRGAFAGAVVLVPTTAMGATLPLIARAACDPARGPPRIEWLYGANTAGGALGSLLGAYVLVPRLGLAASLRTGACVSVAAGLAAMSMARRAPVAPREVPADAGDRQRMPTSIAVAAIASGVLVFASEVLFVHLMALIDGTTVYAFGLVLAVFLVALSLGAAAARALSRATADDALATGLALSGLALAVVVPTWDRLPALFVAAGPFVESWAGREMVRAAVAALAIGVPATCMGMTFPIALAAVAGRADRGAVTGRLAAYNTLGAIGGSVVSGFFLLPALGSQRACWAVALSYVAVAIALRIPPRWPTVAAAVVVCGSVAASPRWDLARLASGANIYFQRQPEQGKVVFVAEDVHGGVVTVTRPAIAGADLDEEGARGAGVRTTLWTNGKYQGDDGPQMQAQRGFADVPAMFVRTFGSALVVGLGTGTTLGELAQYPFERIDVAELSPAIVEAARTFFGRANGSVLGDRRVFVDVEDGRNLLLIRDRSYDLITIELTSVWFAGATNMYTRESYAIAARRLHGDGILSQWIQLHHTTLREIASQMATGRAVFEHAAFFIRGDQGMLVMSRSPLRARPPSPRELDDLLFADDSLDAFIDDVCAQQRTTRGAIVTTDDDRRLEYETPRNNVPGLPGIAETSALLRRWRRPEVIATIAAH